MKGKSDSNGYFQHEYLVCIPLKGNGYVNNYNIIIIIIIIIIIMSLFSEDNIFSIHQTSRRRAFSKIHQSAIEIVCVCLSQVCKTPMLYIILKLRF